MTAEQARSLRRVGKAKRAHRHAHRASMVGTALARLCPPYGTFRRDDTKHSRGMKCPSDASSMSFFEMRGRRECRMLKRTRSLVCNCRKHTSSKPQVRRKNPAFPAQWFCGLYVLFPVTGPVTGLCCHRRLRNHHRKLDPSVGGPEPHDFAGRIGGARPVAPTRPSHPAPNTRDDRVAPLVGARRANKGH
jgi:hypothetical protein